LKAAFFALSMETTYGHRHSAYLADLTSPPLAAGELLQDHHKLV